MKNDAFYRKLAKGMNALRAKAGDDPVLTEQAVILNQWASKLPEFSDDPGLAGEIYLSLKRPSAGSGKSLSLVLTAPVYGWRSLPPAEAWAKIDAITKPYLKAQTRGTTRMIGDTPFGFGLTRANPVGQSLVWVSVMA